MFMVKNAGLLPEFKTIRSGAIQQHRRDMGDIISGCWRSCVETGDGTQGHKASDNCASDGADHLTVPFVADAIVANPPSLAHIHCAEKLGIPLNIFPNRGGHPPHLNPTHSNSKPSKQLPCHQNHIKPLKIWWIKREGFY
jgi:hypothetical protein